MTMVGTPLFVAPEIMISGRYTSKIDSYSFSICIRSEEGVQRYFQNGLRRSLKKKNLNRIGFGFLPKRINERGWRPPLPKKLYKSLKKLIKDCWHKELDQRPTFDEIYNRLNTEVRREVDSKDEPVYTCDFENPLNNDYDYEKPGDNDDGEDSDNEEQIKTLKVRLAELENVEKERENLVEELAKTTKFFKDVTEDVEAAPVVPDFMRGLLAGR